MLLNFRSLADGGTGGDGASLSWCRSWLLVCSQPYGWLKEAYRAETLGLNPGILAYKPIRPRPTGPLISLAINRISSMVTRSAATASGCAWSGSTRRNCRGTAALGGVALMAIRTRRRIISRRSPARGSSALRKARTSMAGRLAAAKRMVSISPARCWKPVMPSGVTASSPAGSLIPAESSPTQPF